ncbi:glycosyltransferase [Anaerocolumna sp. MB42-C2]|uniref:glycosyltransferase n=1 Tax=Anaerocolumna sp. MB42-C2 TaxID=3070997 RepID=UPI0027DF997B|nr:glycosyltransferase [Anaerocolumna sp. MB42-C2]WMJ89809.1 glycosyltransferase [Anaerocolumna sp. MB42-C2]
MYCISVIIPVYMVENYIDECINSVINQTYTNLEIILIDDGSKDRCGEICDEYAIKDSRIKVIHQSNGGLSKARNAGIDIATGDYIGFVDSDDYIEEDMFEFLLQLAISNNADISICGTYNKDLHLSSTYKEYCYTPKEAIKTMLAEKKFNTSAWDKLYKRELFTEIRYPEGKIYEDLATTYKLFHKASKIIYNSKPKYYYRMNSESIMNRSFNLRNMDLLDASIELIEFVKIEYPSITITAYNRLVRYCVSFLKTISDENFYDEEIIRNLVSTVRKHILKYLLSNYKITSKLFAFLISINFSFASLINKTVNRL